MGSGESNPGQQDSTGSLYLLTHLASPLAFHPLVAPERGGRYFSPEKSQLWGRLSQECAFTCPPPPILFWKWIISATCLSDFFNLLLASGTLTEKVNYVPPATEFYSLTKQGQRSLKSYPGRMLSKVWVFYTIWLDMWRGSFICYRILDLSL